MQSPTLRVSVRGVPEPENLVVRRRHIVSTLDLSQPLPALDTHRQVQASTVHPPVSGHDTRSLFFLSLTLSVSDTFSTLPWSELIGGSHF